MSLTKDGFYKSFSGAIGNNNYLLEAGGGHIAWGNAANQIPYSNGTVNTNLNADMLDGVHSTGFFRYEGWWSSGSGQNVNNAEGMTFVYSNHGSPSGWGVLSTFSYQRGSSYKMQLFSNGYTDGYTYYRNQSSDRGGWGPWVRLIDSVNWKEVMGFSSAVGSPSVPIYWTGSAFATCIVSFGNQSYGEHNANNINDNGIKYYNANGPSTSLGASTSDGALYSQAYSTSWVGQIAQDYRNGGLYVRGKNNGTWQSWYRVWDNRTTYVSGGKGYIGSTQITQVNNADTVDGYHALGITNTSNYLIKQSYINPGADSENNHWYRIATIKHVGSSNYKVLLYISTNYPNRQSALVEITYRTNSGVEWHKVNGYFGTIPAANIRLYYDTTNYATVPAELCIFIAKSSTGSRTVNTRVIAEVQRGVQFPNIITLDNNVLIETSLSSYTEMTYVDYLGNAYSATKLETARTITIGATGRLFDGSANISWTLANIFGTSAIGGTAKPIYYNGTNFVAISDTKGSATKPVWLNAGTISECTYSLNATINSGTANRMAWYSGTNAISSASTIYASNTQLTVGGTSAPANSGIFQAIGTSTMRHIYPESNNTYNLGSTSLRWANVFGVLGNYSGQVTVSIATGTAPFAITSTTKVNNLNVDLLDNYHSTMWYKEGLADPNGKSDKPWHLIAEFTQNNASSQINTCITLFVRKFYGATSKESGILIIRCRYESAAATPSFYHASWSLNNSLPVENFIITSKRESNVVTLRLYCKLTGWNTYAFTKISEGGWGIGLDTWKLYSATYSSTYAMASIPTDETQVQSSNIDISNNTASATVASKLGTSNVGSATKGIYLDAGTPKAMTYSLNATVNSGTANRMAWYSGANAISSASTIYASNTQLTVGGTSAPVNSGIFQVVGTSTMRHIYPEANATYNLGSSSLRWKNIYYSGQINSSIETGTAPFIITSTTVNTNLNADLLDGYHYSGTSRGFINIGYNRNGPYWMLIASRNYATDTWIAAKMVFTIASNAYFDRIVTYGIVEVAYSHQNATAGSAPRISAKWLLKSLSTQDDCLRVEINTSTKYINVYLQNNLWDTNIECHVIHADGFNYIGHGLTAGSWITAPALSTNVINPSNAEYYGNLTGNATNADTLDGYHANGLFTDFSNYHNGTNHQLSIDIGGTTKRTTPQFLAPYSDLAYGNSGLQYFNINGTAGTTANANVTPTSAWYHILRMNHGNSAGYFADIAVPLNDVAGMYWRQVRNGTNYGWYKLLDTNNVSPSIGISGNTIRVTVGGVNSSYITVPYATNADKVDGWHQTNLVWSGYVTSGTASLSSYWFKAWTGTITSYQYNDLDLTFLVASGYNDKRGLIHLKIRQNGANSSGAYNFGKSLTLCYGNIPLDHVRLYCNNSTGVCELWMNVVGQYGVYNYTVIKKTWRTDIDITSFGTLTASNFTTAQTVPAISTECIQMSASAQTGLFTNFGNSGNNITATIGGTTKTFTVNYATSAGYLKDRSNGTATYSNYGAAGLEWESITWLTCWNGYELRAISKAEMASVVNVYQHTSNNVDYPLVWSNQNHTSSVQTNQLYKSYNHLVYNPSAQTLKVSSRITSPYANHTQTSMRHLDAGLNSVNTDHQLYIGYGAQTYTQLIRFYYSTGTTDSISSRTEFMQINSNGAYALTRFGVNGQNTSYNFYVNGTSYHSGNTWQVGVLYIGSHQGSWVSGMTTNPSIWYNNGNKIDASSYWAFYAMKSSSNHVINFGGLGDRIGFYGYYAGRTSNSTDWNFTVNMTNGIWASSKRIDAYGFYHSSYGSATYLLRSDGGVAAFNWSGQSGQPSWLWGGNSQHSYYLYNPSNFSVNYANYAGYAHKLDIYGYNTDGLSFYQTSSSFQGSDSSWASYIIANHGNGSTYYNYILRLPFWGPPQYARKTNGNNSSWYTFLTTENGYWADQRLQTSSNAYTVPSFAAIKIRNSSPSYHSADNIISGTAGEIYFAGNFHIDSRGSNKLYLNHYTSNSIAMVTGGGNVGIGTDSPSYGLTLATNKRLYIYGNESNAIYTEYHGNSHISTNSPESYAAIRHGFIFQWYDTYWKIGNVRGGSTNSAGFGIAYSGGAQLQLLVKPGSKTWIYYGIHTFTASHMWTNDPELDNNGISIKSTNGGMSSYIHFIQYNISKAWRFSTYYEGSGYGYENNLILYQGYTSGSNNNTLAEYIFRGQSYGSQGKCYVASCEGNSYNLVVIGVFTLTRTAPSGTTYYVYQVHGLISPVITDQVRNKWLGSHHTSDGGMIIRMDMRSGYENYTNKTTINIVSAYGVITETWWDGNKYVGLSREDVDAKFGSLGSFDIAIFASKPSQYTTDGYNYSQTNSVNTTGRYLMITNRSIGGWSSNGGIGRMSFAGLYTDVDGACITFKVTCFGYLS